MTETIEGAGIVYAGDSLLVPGAPIVAILTSGSVNTKTGPMAQVWILSANRLPKDAVTLGEDDAICGDCRWRGDGTGAGRQCYVNLSRAPSNVYRAYAGGRYADCTTPAQRAALARGQHLRLGAYGDPAAVPVVVWEQLVGYAVGWTGYTHQWRTADPRFKHLCMASVDSDAERFRAQQAGWRTFRAISKFDVEVRRDEVLCPASAEMDHQATCLTCGLCGGLSREARSVAIHAHGAFVPLYRRQQPTFPELVTVGG